MMHRTFLRGLFTGFILQAAVGPIFFYITLALIGVAKLLEKSGHQRTLGAISSLVLLVFGPMLFESVFKTGFTGVTPVQTSNPFFSFSSTLFLTITSPLTIIFWTILFAAKSFEYHFSKLELINFSLAAEIQSQSSSRINYNSKRVGRKLVDWLWNHPFLKNYI